MFRKATKNVASRNTRGFSRKRVSISGHKNRGEARTLRTSPHTQQTQPQHEAAPQGTNDLVRVLAVLHHRNRAAHTTRNQHTVIRIHTGTRLHLAELRNYLLLQATPHNPGITNPQQHQTPKDVRSNTLETLRSLSRTKETGDKQGNNKERQHDKQHDVTNITARINVVTDVTALRTLIHKRQETLIAATQSLILTNTKLSIILTLTTTQLSTRLTIIRKRMIVTAHQRLTTSRLPLLTRRSRTALLRGELRINWSLRLLYNLRLSSFSLSLLFLTTKHLPIIPERHTPNPPPPHKRTPATETTPTTRRRQVRWG